MSRASLARRLLLSSLAALVLALGAGGAALSYAFRRSAEAAFDVRLQAWSDALVGSLATDGRGEIALERPLGDPRFEQAFSGWYWTASAEGSPGLASQSLWDAELRTDAPARRGTGASHVRHAQGPRGQRLRALVRTVTLPGSDVPVRVVLAGEDTELRRETERFDALLFGSLAVLGIALLLVLALQMRLALRPVQVLARELASVRGGRQSRVDGEVPREFAPLVEVVNDLLDHDAALVERARTQTVDLAHALKTPLSLVRLEAEELADERGRRILRHAETMRRHVERRLGGASPRPAVAGQRTPVRPVLEGIAQTLTRLHPTRAIQLVVEEDSAFPGPREDLEEIAGNLLENACKWARSRVRARIREVGGRIQLAVDDDGRGLGPAEREEVLQRGTRLDLQSPGCGLGLGIVRDVATAYRGELRLEASELGGLRAVVTLPA